MTDIEQREPVAFHEMDGDDPVFYIKGDGTYEHIRSYPHLNKQIIPLYTGQQLAEVEARVNELEQAVAYESGDPIALSAHTKLFDNLRDLKRRAATAEAEAERLRALVEDAKKSAFNHGYVLACCNIANLHNEPSIAFDILNELGVTKAEVKAMGLTDYDAKALKEIERSRGAEKPYRAARDLRDRLGVEG